MSLSDTRTPAVPRTMRAAVWSGDGPRLAVEEIPTPSPKADEALVRVRSCGVCHTDLHVLKGEVAFPGPGVVGHEISGTVVSLGDGTRPEMLPAGVAPGVEVVGAFIMPCGACEPCLKGRDDMCETFFRENRLAGNLFDGTSRLARADGERLSMYSMAGLADYAVVPVTALTPLPAGLPPEESAILGCAVFTAFGAARRAEIAEGEAVAVVATGGVGSSLIQVARYLGADPIVAIDISDEKLEATRALGATHVVNSSREDPLEAVRGLTGGKGVDVAFEALGHPATFELAVSLLREGGRMVAVGIAAGAAAASVPITPLVRRGQSVMGSFGARTRVDLPATVAMAAEGGYRVADAVTRRYSLEQADEAYTALSRGEITGRAIVVMGER